MKALFVLLLLFLSINANAFNIWRHPEMAPRNSVFLGAVAPSVYFLDGFGFELQPVVFTADWMLPTRFPFSVGAFVRLPSPNLNSFGLRAAYHIDLNNSRINLYFLYVFDFGWTLNNILIAHNDEEMPLSFFDFRVGVRRLFGRHIGLYVETDFNFRGLVIGLFYKLF